MAQADPVHKFWNVFGHVLDSDGTKIINTFALSVSETGSAEGILLLQSHWEFIRRYMEDGPQSVIGQIQFCLPISEKRESLSVGIHRLLANSSTASPILLPIIWLSMLFSIIKIPFRFFSIQTSKIPKWPESIEKQNEIIKDDPYAIQGDAKAIRLAVFPDAATSANVKFEGPPRNPLHSNAA